MTISNDTINREILKNFNKDDLTKYSPATIHGCPDWLMITPWGEICYDPVENVFIVFDETYTDFVGRTPYPKVAFEMLRSYCDYYLEGKV